MPIKLPLNTKAWGLFDTELALFKFEQVLNGAPCANLFTLQRYHYVPHSIMWVYSASNLRQRHWTMQKFHVLHYIPSGKFHILHGYDEVIESVVWGLRALGHEVSWGVNQTYAGATQIIFGSPFMPDDLLRQFPSNTIIYNLEQLSGCIDSGWDMQRFSNLVGKFQLWDYSNINIEIWKDLFSAENVRHVPVGFAPSLCRIAKPQEQDIDVLLYGSPTPYRSEILQSLTNAGMKVMFFYGLYGKARDDLIGRSKIVLNLKSNPQRDIFSVVRVSYLLANRKAVVSDLATPEGDLVEAVCFGRPENIQPICLDLLDNHEKREGLEETALRVIAARDMRAMLLPALSAMQ
jgi:hypothetical protein